MSRTPSTPPPEDALDDTPPHGVPPVRRAAIASRPRRDIADHEDTVPEDTGHEDTLPARAWAAPATRDDGATAGDRDARGSRPWPGSNADGHPYDDDVGSADQEEGHDERDEGDFVGPVRVTGRLAGRTSPKGRVYESGKRRRLRLTRRGRIVGAVLAVLVVIAGVLAWYEVEANPSGAPGKAVLVDVHSGEPLGTISAALVKDQVISTGFAFHLWSFVHGAPIVRPGTYQIRRNLSFAAAKSVLDAGPNVERLTVVPGTTLSEIASELASMRGSLAHAFSNAGRTSGVHSPFQLNPGTPLEGLIGGGTYRILPGESVQMLLTQMVARFDAQARSAGLTPATTVGGLNAYQLITLASIAQKEGYFTRYMGDVARVIFNRLSDGMNLDMTSTVLYSLGKDGGQVTSQDEQLTTPYNTYLHPGLTPTPICTPSVTALRAAIDAPPGTWLYFDLVTAKTGTMKFASTYTQQLAFVQEAAANAANQSSSGSSGSASGPTT